MVGSADLKNAVIYKGVEKQVKVCVYKQGEHYDTINSMAGFFASNYYCHKCDTPYWHKDSHICKETNRCYLCTGKAHVDGKRVYCPDCNRYCKNEECLKKHRTSICLKWYKCSSCNQIVARKDSASHKCGYLEC